MAYDRSAAATLRTTPTTERTQKRPEARGNSRGCALKSPVKQQQIADFRRANFKGSSKPGYEATDLALLKAAQKPDFSQKIFCCGRVCIV
jgi:hypothetical protein